MASMVSSHFYIRHYVELKGPFTLHQSHESGKVALRGRKRVDLGGINPASDQTRRVSANERIRFLCGWLTIF